VLLGVDAISIHTCERLREWRGKCHHVVFNFPHTGAGIKDEADNARHHRALICNTLLASRAMLDPGARAPPAEVHVTLRKGKPYSHWAVPALADSLEGLRFAREMPFESNLYPGYSHRRTRGLAGTRPDAVGVGVGQGVGAASLASPVLNGAVNKGEGSVTYCFRIE
jgi:25S rRNA (uracil2634-N3)-methyltransferase